MQRHALRLVLVLLSWSFLCDAHAASKACSALVKQQQYDLAATCFQRVAAQMPKDNKKLNPFQRKLKGFYLLNAAKAFQLSAKGQKKPKDAAVLYEKAAKLLQEALDGKLYLKAYEKQSMKGLLMEYLEAIGYSSLIILNDYKEAPQVEIQGYQHQSRQKVTKKWQQQLRPGKYTMRVTFADEPTQKLEFTLAKKESKVLNLKTDIKRQKVSPQQPAIFWLTISGGIALMGAGVAGILVGNKLGRDARDKDFPSLKTASSIAANSYFIGGQESYNAYKAILNQYNDGTALSKNLVIAGSVAIGLGVAAGVVAILFFRNKPKKKTASKTPSPTLPLAGTTNHGTKRVLHSSSF